jgi:hypothetical protein
MPLPRLFANRIISVVLDAARLAETPAPEPQRVEIVDDFRWSGA